MPNFWDSEAGMLAAVAAGALLLAAIAWVGDLRRTRRQRPDDVGIVPWGPLFLAALGIAGLSGFVALQYWLASV